MPACQSKSHLKLKSVPFVLTKAEMRENIILSILYKFITNGAPVDIENVRYKNFIAYRAGSCPGGKIRTLCFH